MSATHIYRSSTPEERRQNVQNTLKGILGAELSKNGINAEITFANSTPINHLIYRDFT